MAQVYMDIPAVQGMAKKFEEIGHKVQQISKAMAMAIVVLKSAAFVGAVGGAVYAAFLERLKPRLDQYADKCAELSKDLESAVRCYQHGDALGAEKFH